MVINKPIPKLGFPIDRGKRGYQDDQLVSALDFFSGEIKVKPIYFMQELPGTENDCKIRLRVAEKLCIALKSLPRGLTFMIFDSYRTVKTQQALYDNYCRKLRDEHPQWSEEILEKEVIKFVSKPSFDENNPFVHNTGGAIDLTLYDKRNSRELIMGTVFDDFSSRATTCYFEDIAWGTEAKEIRNNRRLLYWCMIKAGFTNLPTEWWHYDFGDKFWSFYTGNPAIYKGIIE